MSNMKIWNAVSKTNPADTKQVSQRGGFTSICAQSQIRSATEQFGPIGQGWGYIAHAPIFHDRLVFVPVSLWHGDRANIYGPMTGGAEWQDKNGRTDSDAIKKATTDAITKLLSQLGFNADVFLGLYDDSKYVEAVKREFEAPPAVITEEQRVELMDLFAASGVAPGPILARASQNAGREVKDLRELPVSEFEPLKKFLTSKKEAA